MGPVFVGRICIHPQNSKFGYLQNGRKIALFGKPHSNCRNQRPRFYPIDIPIGSPSIVDVLGRWLDVKMIQGYATRVVNLRSGYI